MKNLVSQNRDAASQSAVQLIDPADLGDYRHAQVSLSGLEAPSETVIFKQEVPDLVVQVGTKALITPTYVIGTWRDINIETTPEELIEQGEIIDLNPYDYDNGHIGIVPLVRTASLSVDPGPPRQEPGLPNFIATDGELDVVARQWTSESQGLSLWLGYNEQQLYLATEPAMSGNDHLVVISFDTPSTLTDMPWAKLGQMVASSTTVFLAMEGDGNFQGWFQRPLAPGLPDVQIETMGTQASSGRVLEGSLDLSALGTLPNSNAIWIAVVAFQSADGGALVPASQTPAGNGDFHLDLAEFVRIPLPEIRSFE